MNYVVFGLKVFSHKVNTEKRSKDGKKKVFYQVKLTK